MDTKDRILAVALVAFVGALTAVAIHGGWFDYDAAIGASIGAALGLLLTHFTGWTQA